MLAPPWPACGASPTRCTVRLSDAAGAVDGLRGHEGDDSRNGVGYLRRRVASSSRYLQVGALKPAAATGLARKGREMTRTWSKQQKEKKRQKRKKKERKKEKRHSVRVRGVRIAGKKLKGQEKKSKDKKRC